MTIEPYTDILHLLTKPLVIASGGYAIIWNSGGQQEVFGRDVPAWRLQHKRRVGSRGYKRMVTDYEYHRFNRGASDAEK